RHHGSGLFDFLFRMRKRRALRTCGDDRGPVAGIGLARAPEAIAIGPEAGVGVDGKFLVAVRRSAFLGGAVPGAAAENAHLAQRRPVRIRGMIVGVMGFAIPVVAPLPDVAMNVVQSPAIGLLLADWMR